MCRPSCAPSLSRTGRSNLARELEQLRLQSVIEGVDATAPSSRTFKIDFIIRQWEQANRPLLWIEPHATVSRHPVLPQALGCDFAAYKWRSGQIETGLLFFHQTEPARALLDTWQSLTRNYPDAPESFLLDQAWTLVSSQRQLETAWLPDDYWRSANSGGPRNRTAVVQYDHRTLSLGSDQSMASRVQRARRFGRHQAPESHLVMQGASAGRMADHRADPRRAGVRCEACRRRGRGGGCLLCRRFRRLLQAGARALRLG